MFACILCYSLENPYTFSDEFNNHVVLFMVKLIKLSYSKSEIMKNKTLNHLDITSKFSH